jgi:colanic acid biosynthesis glycosyl transferase WcaI
MLYQAARGADLVIVIEPSFLNSPVALLASRLAGALAWLHIQDYELDLAYDLSHMRRGRKLAEKIETWMMNRFDAVSSISHRMLEKARHKGVARDSLSLLPNSVDLAEIRPLFGESSMREELGIPANCVVALFAGSLGAKHGVETVVEVARILVDDPKLLFVICGDGAEAQSLRTEARGLANVRFLPLQPADRLNGLLNLADVHVLPQRQAAAQSVLPSKLINMLASGRPVIAACDPGSEIAELVSGCGIAVAPGDPDAMALAIRTLMSNPDARARMGEEARRRAVARFSKDSILHTFERDLLDRLHRTGRGIREGLAPE